MKRNIAKICALSLFFCMFFSVNAFAGQTRYVEYVDEPFSFGYMDKYNVPHDVCGTISAHITGEWDEGYAGWIISANFGMPYVTVDGESVNVEYYEVTNIKGTAWQTYEVNSSEQYFTAKAACDEYGEISFWVEKGKGR